VTPPMAATAARLMPAMMTFGCRMVVSLVRLAMHYY
jgi:hypothetical protein